MDYIILPCVQQLKISEVIFTDNGVKPIAHFDKFKGQYLNPEMHQPYPLPAIFFKFNIVWEDLANNTQKGSATMEVHLELENYAESADGSPDQDAALLDYEYMRVVSALLHGFKTAQFSALKRRTTDEDDNPGSTNVTIIRFQTEILDESMDRYRNWLRQPLDDVSLKKLPYDATPPGAADDDEYSI